LRDKLKIIEHAEDTEAMANSISDTGGVYLVPAFTGLGAPYWDPEARGTIVGLTRNSNREDIVRAALESVAYQTRDLLGAMLVDYKSGLDTLRVDGGMTANNWLLQFISDMLDSTIERPDCIDTTALGAAYLAGLQLGVYQSLDEIQELWRMNKRFQPNMTKYQREYLYQGWKRSVQSMIKNKI
jgi:glycerol kinase